jgi:hypothetical protein
LGKLSFAVVKIFALKAPQKEHLFGGKVRQETWIEASALRGAETILIGLLETIINQDGVPNPKHMGLSLKLSIKRCRLR